MGDGIRLTPIAIGKIKNAIVFQLFFYFVQHYPRHHPCFIKYGQANSQIDARIEVSNRTMVLSVENKSPYSIDPNVCFERGTRFAGQSVEGGGFGLFLAREIVLAHQGTITCKTEGATICMTVKIPLLDVMQD